MENILAYEAGDSGSIPGSGSSLYSVMDNTTVFETVNLRVRFLVEGHILPRSLMGKVVWF